MVGSSRMSSSGRFISDSAIASRRWKPPDSCAHRHVGVRAQLEEVDQLVDAARQLRLAQQVVAAEDAQVVDRRQRLDQHVLLQRHAEARPHGARVARDVDAEHADRARWSAA